MTAATDALARARAELYAAEEMGSPEVDVAQAAVEQAEETVGAEQEYTYDDYWWDQRVDSYRTD